ncbi:MAG: hypothetical protein E6G10_23465 [Actinobacteria bacterium]|nr:MAG: hypothetical protein E6G10_23465 [Actinomycetota bacterium]
MTKAGAACDRAAHVPEHPATSRATQKDSVSPARMLSRHLGKLPSMTVERIIEASEAVTPGRWTTYAEVADLVYGHRRGAQTVGNVLRAHGKSSSAHHTLLAGGKVSPHWRGDEGGPEECIRRLRDECATPAGP